MTTEQERGRGMPWVGTAVSLGFVVGPALSGALHCRDPALPESRSAHVIDVTDDETVADWDITVTAAGMSAVSD